jgi:hypothetical protein
LAGAYAIHDPTISGWNDRFAPTAAIRTSDVERDVRYSAILLQKSKVASVQIFGETIKREAIDDSDNLSRATEVAYEFSVRR